MTQIICLISVIILAILTQHAISWAGSMLHQIGDTGQNYALFIFSDDRHQPMTNNILMNIFILIYQYGYVCMCFFIFYIDLF